MNAPMLNPVMLPGDRPLPPRWSGMERRWFLASLAVSAALYLLYALFCEELLHPDEYFQVVEFASFKLGRTAVSDMPWEFADRMRSWLQPAICFELIRVGQLFGVERPLAFLTLFRLVFGFLSWASLWTFVAAGRRWLSSESDRVIAYAIAALLWYIPTIGVRASGESASTALLCLSIASLEYRRSFESQRHRFGLAVAGGFALALCFASRFPSGAMAAGVALAYLYDRAGRGQLIGGLCLGGFAGLGVMFAVDWWGYGAPAIPFLNYFEQNFVQDHAAFFGTEPFYAYLYLPLREPFGLIAVAGMTVMILAWLRRPGHVVTWATLPYVFLLMLTSHKETRFLYPLVFFVPFFTLFALAPAQGEHRPMVVRTAMNVLLGGLAIVNLIALVLTPIKLGYTGEHRLFYRIDEEARKTPGQLDLFAVRGAVRQIYTQSLLPMQFLKPKNLKLTATSDMAVFEGLFTSERKPFLVVVDVPNPHAELSERIAEKCTRIEATIPKWMLERQNWRERADRIRLLYRCD